MLNNTPSPVRALLAMQSIAAAGIERSIVFEHLPPEAQARIRAASTKEEKIDIAAEAGDSLPAVAEMHQHFVVAPMQRLQSGIAFPALDNLDRFPLPGILREEDRAWLRMGHTVREMSMRERDGHWVVVVDYADGETRIATPADACHTKDEAEQLHKRIARVSDILHLR